MLGDGAILVPTFGNRKTDQAAIKLLKQLRPHAKVVGVDASTFILGRERGTAPANSNLLSQRDCI